MSTFFEHVGPKARIQKVLNVLCEAPFFYRSDDAELFAFLRRHRAEVERFFEESFGWQLVVDARCARLYKPQWHNSALKPSQHDVFEPTRRDECIAFLLVLEFHEHLLEERNVAADDPDPLRFELGELFTFARTRLREELGAHAPDDDGVRKLLRAIFPALLRYRFVREIEPDRELRETLDRDRWLYECLPAFSHYDVRALGRPALSAAYARAAEAAEAADAAVAAPDEEVES